MKLLLDAGIARSTAELLRDSGFDAVHVAEVALSNADDHEVIAFARAASRVVITMDTDFRAIPALSGASCPSVVRVRIEGLRAPDMARLADRVLDECRNDLDRGAVVSVTSKRVRVRYLPILR